MLYFGIGMHIHASDLSLSQPFSGILATLVYNDADLEWHVPILGEICHAENIYQFSGPSPSAISEKNQSMEIFTN